MSDSFPFTTRARFSRRLAVFYGAFFLCIGVLMPFLPLWFKAREVEPAWIGLLLSFPALSRIIAVPFLTRLAERQGALRAGLIASAFATMIGFVLMGFAPVPLAIAALYAVTAIVWTPMLPLADGYALRGVAQHGMDYGPVRLWGSAAFIVGALGAGALVPWLGASNIIWIVVASAGLGAVASLLLAPIDPPRHDKRETLPARLLLGIQGYVFVVIAAALIQGSHSAYYAFSTIAWRAGGIDDFTISALWSVGVVAEIVFFWLSPRMNLKPQAFLMIGAGAAVLRWLLLATDLPLPLIVVVQVLHGLTYGATQLGMMGLFAQIVPPGLAATSQGVYTAMSGVVMASAGIASGWLYEWSGSAMYGAMAMIAACGGLVVLRFWRLRPIEPAA